MNFFFKTCEFEFAGVVGDRPRDGVDSKRNFLGVICELLVKPIWQYWVTHIHKLVSQNGRQNRCMMYPCPPGPEMGCQLIKLIDLFDPQYIQLTKKKLCFAHISIPTCE